MPEPTSTSAGIIASLLAGNEHMARVSFAFLGFMGSLLSMQFIDHMSNRQRAMAVFTSIIIADVGAQWLADTVGAPQHAYGAAGMIGLFGFSLYGAAMKGIKETDVAGIIKGFFDAINSRISGR
jgi:hypothetical protein